MTSIISFANKPSTLTPYGKKIHKILAGALSQYAPVR